MRCSDLMKMSVFVCGAADSAADCARVMRDRNIGFLPVVDVGARLVGVVTDRDLALRVLAEGLPATTLVGEVMTRDPIVCEPEEPLRTAEDRLVQSGRSRIVVVDDQDHCIGVIALDDIAHAETTRRAGEVLRNVTRRRVQQRR